MLPTASAAEDLLDWVDRVRRLLPEDPAQWWKSFEEQLRSPSGFVQIFDLEASYASLFDNPAFLDWWASIERKLKGTEARILSGALHPRTNEDQTDTLRAVRGALLEVMSRPSAIQQRCEDLRRNLLRQKSGVSQ